MHEYYQNEDATRESNDLVKLLMLYGRVDAIPARSVGWDSSIKRQKCIRNGDTSRESVDFSKMLHKYYTCQGLIHKFDAIPRLDTG